MKKTVSVKSFMHEKEQLNNFYVWQYVAHFKSRYKSLLLYKIYKKNVFFYVPKSIISIFTTSILENKVMKGQ